MKYRDLNISIPAEKRVEYNEKILHVIRAGNGILTPEEIYNAFTGRGGLHGLDFDDYDSRTEFGTAKKVFEQGQFFTPAAVAGEMVELVAPKPSEFIADLTCGVGAFFNFCPNEHNLYGCEIDADALAVAEHLYPHANLTHGNIIHYAPSVKFDLVFGNPPFNLDWRYNGNRVLSQQFYIEKAAELLHPGGMLVLVTPKTFLEDEFSQRQRLEYIAENFRFLGQYKLDLNAFKRVGVERFPTKVMALQRRAEGLAELPYSNEYLSRAALRAIVAEARQTQHSARVKLEAQRAQAQGSDFDYRVKKMLWAIASHPATRAMKHKAEAYYRLLYEQEKPAVMDPEEWQRKKVTENKVLRFLRDIMAKMNAPKFPDELRLVKTSKGLEYRAHGPQSKKQLKAMQQKNWTHGELTIGDCTNPPDGAEPYLRHYRRKAAWLEQQLSPIDEIQPAPKVARFVEDFWLESPERTIALTELQRSDTAKAFSKRYAVLNWQQGCGKTIAGMCWIEYMRGKVDNVIVLSSPKAIYQTWVAHLDEFGREYMIIDKPGDFTKLRPGVIVLLRFTKLNLRHAIKKYLRRHRCALLVDESHRLSSYASKRTRLALTLFRRMRYKLLMTGTTTRNNVVELYPQIELLYNNSLAMECRAEQAYYLEDDQINSEPNEIYGQPFPAFHGLRHWKACFSPAKTTVFGIKKQDQDVYNADELRRILRYTVLTRRFEDIVGPDRYQYHTHTFAQNEAERGLYEQIMEEFYQMIPRYFDSKGYRKDTYLRIIRQLQLMINAASMPHLFGEWTGNGELPTKLNKILAHVAKHDEKIAIGVLTHKALGEYRRQLAAQFPVRQLFVISGEVPFSTRISIIDAFQRTANGILLATQQSLDESINIAACNHVIVESLQWNLPNIEQFAFRFIRFNSTQKTHVHFFYYKTSIEPNLMALLLKKENINSFVRTLEFADEERMMDEFDVDPRLFQWIIEKGRDRNGAVKLRWGQQEIFN